MPSSSNSHNGCEGTLPCADYVQLFKTPCLACGIFLFGFPAFEIMTRGSIFGVNMKCRLRAWFLITACICAVSSCSSICVSVAANAQEQPNPALYRPAFHFSPEKNWINDPAGLVFDGSEYHLFNQYNPFGDQWGHMSWSHAVSKDLVSWQELPVALNEENGIGLFTGSAVLDAGNTCGFGRNGIAPLVAVYTGNSPGLQTQNVAYSIDHGRTWTRYAGNPVLDLHESDFRDPMVFWYEPDKHWVMVASLALKHKVLFFSSPDLKAWTKVGEFGPAGANAAPNWECPNLFELPVVNVKGPEEMGARGGHRRQWLLGWIRDAVFRWRVRRNEVR